MILARVKLLFFLFLSLIVFQCSCEDCEYLGDDFENSYFLVNQTEHNVSAIAYFKDVKQHSHELRFLDTSDNSSTLLPNLDKLTDSAEIRFFLTPIRCLKIQGKITDSLTDIRSSSAYEQGGLPDSTESYVSLIIRTNFYYTIDSTHLNQATEEACTE